MDDDRIMKQVHFGRVITVGGLRAYFAEENDADFTEPITAGIFVSIAAWASFQRNGEDETPWWRTLKADGELNPQFPGGIDAQRRKLEAEGHTIICRGRCNLTDTGSSPPSSRPADPFASGAAKARAASER